MTKTKWHYGNVTRWWYRSGKHSLHDALVMLGFQAIMFLIFVLFIKWIGA